MISIPIRWALGLMAAILAIGVAGYMYIEGWDALDATWMVLITLTTIGFGEIHPLSPPGRVFTMGLILSGLGVVAYTTTQLTQVLIEGRLPAMYRERRRKQMRDRMRDHYIVIGYGRLGRAVVEELLAAGADVCVIEREEDLLSGLDHRCAVVIGDGADDEVLRQAGIQRARGVAVAVSSGAEAVYATLSAHELNPRLQIVTRVADPGHAVKAKRAGASSVVSPHTMGGWRMAHGLIRPHATSFLDLATLASHEDILLEECEILPGSPLAGRTIGTMQPHPPGHPDRLHVLVIAIRQVRGRMIPTPRADQPLSVGDVLIVIGAPGPVRAFGALTQPC